jgi:DNA-binding FrmR family transcriptional regulator
MKKNTADSKKKILIGLKKANTLLAKVVKMVEEDHYCIEVMQQNLAVIGLLRSAHESLMENHLNTCFKAAMATKDEKRKKQMTEEILKVTSFYNK